MNHTTDPVTAARTALEAIEDHVNGAPTPGWLLRHLASAHGVHAPGSATQLVATHRLTHARELQAAAEAYEDAWDDEQAARGPLAGAPDQLDCYTCGWDARLLQLPHQTDSMGLPYVPQQVVALGPVTGRADPTQTYLLACRHGAF